MSSQRSSGTNYGYNTQIIILQIIIIINQSSCANNVFLKYQMVPVTCSVLYIIINLERFMALSRFVSAVTKHYLAFTFVSGIKAFCLPRLLVYYLRLSKISNLTQFSEVTLFKKNLRDVRVENKRPRWINDLEFIVSPALRYQLLVFCNVSTKSAKAGGKIGFVFSFCCCVLYNSRLNPTLLKPIASPAPCVAHSR